MGQLPLLRNKLVTGRGAVVCERERTQGVEKVLVVSGAGEAVGMSVCTVDLSASGGGSSRPSSDR